jgi:hypothetical protein
VPTPALRHARPWAKPSGGPAPEKPGGTKPGDARPGGRA